MRNFWRGAGLALACVVTVAGPALAQPAQPARSVLEEILEIMRRSGQITEEQRRQLLQRAEQEAKQAQAERERLEKERAGPVTAGIDRERLRPYLATPDGSFRIELGGFAQFDYAAGDSDGRLLTGPKLNDQFLVRRARLSVQGQAFKWIGFKIEGDFTSSISLTDGYIDLNFLPEIGLRGGQFKQPFSLEELTSDLYIDFIERSLVNELVPSRDFGAMLQGQLFGGILGYAVSVYNGNGQNNADNNSDKDFGGRLVLTPFKTSDISWLKKLQLGFNATYGDQGDNRTSARGRNLARTGNRFQWFAPQATGGDRTRWGGDLAWLIGPLSIKGEYVQQIDERKKLGPGGSDLDDVTAKGFYVTATYVLTGEDSVLNGPVVPRRPFSPFTGALGPGAWELAVRYQGLEFDSDDPMDFFDGNIGNGVTVGNGKNKVDALTVGVNWYLNSRIRLMANYTYYWYDNDFATPTSCRLTTCRAADLRRGDDAWEFQTRLQFWF